MAKELASLNWVEELLPSDFIRKPMFGGFAYYVNERIVLALFENSGDRSYRDQKFDFEIWNGCLFPTEREYHSEIKKTFPILIQHPVLTKWLYLPLDTEDFEDQVESILKEIRRGSKFFGVIPKPKKPKQKTESKVKIDTRRPLMFRDEPLRERLSKANKISDLKNLGPVSEKEFQKAGIRTVDQFVKLGWKKTLEKLVKANAKNRHPVFTYALIGALTNTDWNRLSEREKQEAKDFTRSLKVRKGKK